MELTQEQKNLIKEHLELAKPFAEAGELLLTNAEKLNDVFNTEELNIAFLEYMEEIDTEKLVERIENFFNH